MKYAEAKRTHGQAKDISDAQIVEAVRATRGIWGCASWAMRSDVEAALSQFHHKVVAAKLNSAVRRGLLHGCTCGCRGDFEIPGEELGSEWYHRETARRADERWAALCDEHRRELTSWVRVIPGQDLMLGAVRTGTARWLAIRDGNNRYVEWRDVRGAEAHA